ncbi:MAG: ACP S-malonyltransferase [Deinococcota bacterium]
MIAALFPGQGAQKVGMAQDFYDHSPAAKTVLDQAEAVLPGLLEVMWQGPEETLTLTTNQQPALLAASAAALVAYQEAGGPAFTAAAGHSLGEFSAYYSSGALPLDAALKLVRARASHMQHAVPAGTGTMAAILKLDAAQVTEVCENTLGIVEVANYNSPQQTVISGEVAAVEAASASLKHAGGRVVPLPVSAPFHCSLMAPAASAFQEDLAAVSWEGLTYPIVSNVDAKAITTSNASVDLLTKQVTQSVYWTASIETLVDMGVKVFLEFGSGTVLTNLVKRIVPKNSGITAFAIHTMTSLDSALRQLEHLSIPAEVKL